MANIQNLIDLLMKHEGVRNKPYEDTVGVLTIGVGRNLDDVGLSIDEIHYLLKNDIKRCRHELSGAFDWFLDLDPVRQDAMMDMCLSIFSSLDRLSFVYKFQIIFSLWWFYILLKKKSPRTPPRHSVPSSRSTSPLW